MKKILLTHLAVMILVACSGCCSVTTLKIPVFEPSISAKLGDSRWILSIDIPAGGNIGHKFLNPDHIRGTLWLAYRLQVFESGIATLDTSDVVKYQNYLKEFHSGNALHEEVLHSPTLSDSGVAVLRWKILLASNMPRVGSEYSREEAVEVLSGSDVVGISSATSH